MFRESQQQIGKRMNQLERYKKVYSSTSKNFNALSSQRGSYFGKFKAIIDRDQNKWKQPSSIEQTEHSQHKIFNDVEKLKPIIKESDRNKNKIKTCSNVGSDKNLNAEESRPYEKKSKRKSQNIQFTTLIRRPAEDFSVKPQEKSVVNYQLFHLAGDVASIGHLWGKMTINDTLGSGAYGLVKSGALQGNQYAIKIYQKYKLIDLKKRRRVYTQISLLKKLPPHENVIKFYEALQDKSQIHMILEYVPGSMTLSQYFKKNFLRLGLQQIRSVFAKIVAGVAHLHKNGIAHRDIKPENVLFEKSEDETDINIKIIDFGFATKNIKSDLQCGTPNFMAPELFAKFQKHDPKKADIWALGVTLFYLCESRYPFKGFDQRNLAKIIKQGKYQISKTTDQQALDIIQKMLTLSPAQRIAVDEVMEHPFLCNKSD